jgi:hypothetical protein
LLDKLFAIPQFLEMPSCFMEKLHNMYISLG